MKKIFSSIIIVFILLLNTVCTICAHAETNNYTYYNQPNYNEIISDEQLILDSANDMMCGKISRQITSADIFFDEAIRVYVDTDILVQDYLNSENISSYINETEYVYILPVQIDSSTLFLTISKGEELNNDANIEFTDEEIEIIENREGRWYVPEISIGTNTFNYKTAVENVLSDNNISSSNIIFVGGLCSEFPLTAVCFNGGTDIDFIDVTELHNSSYQSGSSGQSTYLYSFSEVKSIANSNTLQNGQVGGKNAKINTENKKIVIVLFSVTIISLIMICVILTRKKEGIKRNEKAF